MLQALRSIKSLYLSREYSAYSIYCFCPWSQKPRGEAWNRQRQVPSTTTFPLGSGLGTEKLGPNQLVTHKNVPAFSLVSSYSKCDSRVGSINTTWNLVRKAPSQTWVILIQKTKAPGDLNANSDVRSIVLASSPSSMFEHHPLHSPKVSQGQH